MQIADDELIEQRRRAILAFERDLPMVDASTLLRRLIAETHYGNLMLEELLRTSRFNRGGYDGPFLVGRSFTLGAGSMDDPIEVFAGRGEPAAILLQTDGTGVATDRLFVSDTRDAMRGGFSVSLASETEIRIIADRRQPYYAAAFFTGVPTSVVVRVREGRL